MNSPAVLAAMIAILSLLNYAVSALALRDQSRQNFVQHDDYLPPGPVGKVRSHRAQLALPFFLAIVVIIVTLSTDRLIRETFGGGYLVVLVASFAMNLASFLSVRALLNPAAAEGRIHYSAMYRYRSTAAQTLGFALFSGTVGILFGNLAFFAGALFLLATALGYYRRARQVSRRALRRAATLVLTLLIVVFIASVWRVIRAPVEPPPSPLVINDVSQLNPIRVSEIITPTTTEEIAEAVRRHAGPISIGGARHSMGGQIATGGALYIDMRHFNRILDFSPGRKTITVQAGARWREIQERIDPANLAVKIMQSYATFTVGGSLSVNGHGRYVGLGPLISSVKSLSVVLADGSMIDASPTGHVDIFNGVIGGYGGLGVITEATLELADNVKVRRQDEVMPVAQYRRYFVDRIRGSTGVFHSAYIYPNAYEVVRSVTHLPTDVPVTVNDRLTPTNQSYRLNRLMFWIVSEWPLGHAVRRALVDPIYFTGEPVTWRNYEASLDAAELEPASREGSTYVLQEYFVPLDRFDDFVPQMRDVLRRRRVNVINVSIRHASPDRSSLLSWARTEVFAFVIYYKQGTDESAKRQVGIWTREMIDAVLNVGGSYYLPYQLHASEEQFRRAYPRAGEFFALKRQLDPTNKFRNELLDKYYHPASADVADK